jgi:type IV pilus assembly protein PilA
MASSNLKLVWEMDVKRLLNLLALAIVATGVSAQNAPHAQTEPTDKTEAAARAAIKTILHAEMVYFSAWPATGFTCSLADLGGDASGRPNEHHAILIPNSLSEGKKDGYTYRLSGCGETPAVRFRLVATPDGNGGHPAYCADESGTIHSAADGKADACLASLPSR